MVREFHETFGHPVRAGAPTADLPEERLRMRFRLVAEEFAELVGAALAQQHACPGTEQGRSARGHGSLVMMTSQAHVGRSQNGDLVVP
jgi:hypothetical protein